MDDIFLLPDRYEGLETHMEPKDISKIITPVGDAIEKVQDFYEEMMSSGRGAFFILKGQSGCGKTTFLNTLPIFISDIEIVTIDNSKPLEVAFDTLNHQTSSFRIIVIEGRESILDMKNTEVVSAIHKINTFIRSKIGVKTLIVWPCNNDDIVSQLVETSRVVGGTALLGVKETYFEFSGPPKNDYVRIAKQTTELLNKGKTLLDFGITDTEAQSLLADVNTIGEYLKVINAKVRENKKFVNKLAIKERCALWVLVLALNEPSKDVEAITKGEYLDADIQRMLVSTDANIVQDIKKCPEQIALAANYLNCKVIYISIVEALAIVRSYADDKLKAMLKERGSAITPDRDIGSRVANTELVRMIQQDTKLKGRKGTTGSKSKEAFEKLLKISESNDAMLNKTFGEALKSNGFVNDYSTEEDFGDGLTRRTDLVCQGGATSLRLEFMWRKKTSKAEISNYVLTKLFNYGKALGLIS